MNKTHIILSLRSQLLCDILYDRWCYDYDVHVVPNDNDEFAFASELLNLLNNGDFLIDDPVVVIMSIESIDKVPAAVSRLLFEFPELTILGFCGRTHRIRSFQLRVDIQEISSSLAGLIDAIRNCASSPPLL
jgi:hypothetical protein